MENIKLGKENDVFTSASRTPMRTCIACRAKAPASTMKRIGRDNDSPISWPGHGRSAYICPNETCIADAMKKGRLERALRASLNSHAKAALELELKCRLR